MYFTYYDKIELPMYLFVHCCLPMQRTCLQCSADFVYNRAKILIPILRSNFALSIGTNTVSSMVRTIF